MLVGSVMMDTRMQSAAELWTAVAAERHQEVSRICEVNVKSATVALALLQRFPAASYVGLDFRRSANASSAFERSLPLGRAMLVRGDRLRTVRSSELLSGCTILIVDTEDPAPARTRGTPRNLLLDDLPNALQRVQTSNTLFVSGARCERGRSSAKPRSWCAAWAEFVTRRLVEPIRCDKRAVVEGGRSGWCAGSVQTASACIARPPFLERAGRRNWPVEEVRAELKGHWRYYSVFDCPAAARAATKAAVRTVMRGSAAEASMGTCLIFKDHVFEAWVGGMQSADGIRFARKPVLVLPVTWKHARMTHNLAILRDPRDSAGYTIVGGQYKIESAARCGRRAGHYVPCLPQLPKYTGVWISHGRTWRYTAEGEPIVAATAPVQQAQRRPARSSRL